MKNPVDDALGAVRAYAKENSMELNGRILTGLSGGADSVTLLLILLKLGAEPVCVHVNHMIRGADADADEQFCRDLCSGLGVEFHAFRVDVPELSKKLKKGVEETARDERRRIFKEALTGYGCRAVAVAHNANDRAETLLFNLARGTGPRGLGSIRPVREEDGIVYLRPLLCLSRAQIDSFLAACGQTHVTDKTNADTDYTRNYIRAEVLLRFERINPSYLSNINKAAMLCAEADDFITVCAEEYLFRADAMTADSLSSLHPAVFKKTFSLQYGRTCGEALSDAHLRLISAFIPQAENGQRLSFPSGIDLICENGAFRFLQRSEPLVYSIPIENEGEYAIPGRNSVIFAEYVGSAKPLHAYKNFYKLVKRIKISSDIIKNGVFVRNRRDSDFVVSGGMTHTVKKILSDRKVPSSLRGDYPVVCDRGGILFVPPFYVRDGVRGDEAVYLTYCEFEKRRQYERT